MGLKFENLKCNEEHVLIQKYDGTPACVTPKTAPKLIERGWSKYQIPFSEAYWNLPVCDPNPEYDFGKCRSTIPPQNED